MNIQIRGIRFSRNFGKSQALHAGFLQAEGKGRFYYGCRFAGLT